MIDLIKKLNIKKNYIYILFAVGILLVIFSYIMPKSNSDETVLVSDTDYISGLETRLEEIISKIDGAGESDVMVSINSTTESVYVKENKSSYDNDEGKSKGDSEDSVLTMKDSSGNEYALMTKQIMPSISGVTVVCEGGNSVYVKNSIISAVSTLLNIGTNNVCVIAKAK